MQKIRNKIKNNIQIYKQDLETKGLYWSIIHRLYKIPTLKKPLTPIVNFLKPNYVMVEGHKLSIDKQDTAVSQELILSGKWEEYETEIFKQNIKIGDVVVDIGAHIGYYTLLAAHIVGDTGKVYAFEPDPKSFHILQKNVKQNGYKNVVLVNKAVSNKSGEAMLFLNNENTGDHRIYDSKDQRKSLTITTITLDEIFQREEKKIDLIKMDIQGSEVYAFIGAKKIIDMNKHIKIISEFWPKGLKLSGSSAEEYLNFLEENTFKLYNIDENKKGMQAVSAKQLLKRYLPEEDDAQTNVLCIRS